MHPFGSTEIQFEMALEQPDVDQLEHFGHVHDCLLSDNC